MCMGVYGCVRACVCMAVCMHACVRLFVKGREPRFACHIALEYLIV